MHFSFVSMPDSSLPQKGWSLQTPAQTGLDWVFGSLGTMLTHTTAGLALGEPGPNCLQDFRWMDCSLQVRVFCTCESFSLIPH